MLSKKHRVLVVDMDMQANVSQMLYGQMGQPGGSVVEAIAYGVKRNENLFGCYHGDHCLDIIPSRDDLAMFTATEPKEYMVIDKMLQPIRDQYDFILLDTPPSLGSQLIASLMASDFCILMTMTHPWAVDAAVRFTNRLQQLQTYNERLQLLGVVIALFEKNAVNRKIANEIRTGYGDLVFDTLIHKRAPLAKMSMHGIKENTSKQREALEQYAALAEEVIERAK
jgi:chromosome partitioning protein